MLQYRSNLCESLKRTLTEVSTLQKEDDLYVELQNHGSFSRRSNSRSKARY